MKLLVTLITYNRLPYTQRTLKDLRNNTELDYYLVVSDNNSTDGTHEWLDYEYEQGWIDHVIKNPDNYYPGKATNIGWTKGLELYDDATHLMRLDNDMMLQKNWDLAAEEYFDAIPELGQLGIDHEAIEHPKAPLREREINGKVINPWPGCVGGPCIIPRKVWEAGARWPEMRWNDGRKSALQEDSQFSKQIQGMGYLTGHMTENLSRTFANENNWHEFPEYYKKTMQERGYDDRLNEAGL